MPTYSVPVSAHGTRLDGWLSNVCADYSRSRLQQLIRDGYVRVNGEIPKVRQPVAEGDVVTLEPPPPQPSSVEPEAIPLDVLYEDAALIVLNKPANLVVHPAAGHAHGTLVNALLHHCSDLAGIGGERRPGIVHRLDKDTSGVMVVAKTETAMHALGNQFKERQVRKQYLALVKGQVQPETGCIETLIGRDPHHRKKMSARVESGRPARTRYTTRERFTDATLLDVTIETGRTHQIRVHLAHLGYPIWGDKEYGRARILPGDVAADRQMLHAHTLAFTHPVTGAALEFTAPIPDDLRAMIRHLRTCTPAPPPASGRQRNAG